MNGINASWGQSENLVAVLRRDSGQAGGVIEQPHRKENEYSQRLVGLIKDLGVLAERLSVVLDKGVHQSSEKQQFPKANLSFKGGRDGRVVSNVKYDYKLVKKHDGPDKRTYAGEGVLGALDTVGVKPDDIFSAFTQGAQGNCVVISAIKAAMMKFGHNPYGIYKNIKVTPQGYDIVMRDDFKLHITHEEVELAMSATGFQAPAPSDVLTHAKFLFAVSAKRMQLERYYHVDAETFNDCILVLNTGDYPGEALRRLGLSTRVAAASMKDLRNGAIGTLTAAGHVGVVVDGYLDHYGKVKLTDTNRGIAGNIGIKLL